MLKVGCALVCLRVTNSHLRLRVIHPLRWKWRGCVRTRVCEGEGRPSFWHNVVAYIRKMEVSTMAGLGGGTRCLDTIGVPPFVFVPSSCVSPAAASSRDVWGYSSGDVWGYSSGGSESRTCGPLLGQRYDRLWLLCVFVTFILYYIIVYIVCQIDILRKIYTYIKDTFTHT